eukprot:m.55870 g.55870  ORF g.55870 m.55870 type:complete len:1011 (+) comp22148_c0_seq2:1-3033(+)
MISTTTTTAANVPRETSARTSRSLSSSSNPNPNPETNTLPTSPAVYLTPPPHPRNTVIDVNHFVKARLTDPSGVEYANMLIRVMEHGKLLTVREIAQKTSSSAVHFIKLKNSLASQSTPLHFAKLIDGTKTECTDWAFTALTHLGVTRRKRLQSVPGKNGEATKWFLTDIKSNTAGSKLFDPETNVPQAKAHTGDDQAGEDLKQLKNKLDCEFCHMKGEPRGCGPILGPFVAGVHQKSFSKSKKKLIHVHKYCAEYAFKVFHEKDPENSQQPILNAESVTTACAYAKNARCCICSKYGANIVCGAGADKCNKMFHLPCAIQRHYDLHEFKVFCAECEKPNLATSIVKVLNSPQKPTSASTKQQQSLSRQNNKKPVSAVDSDDDLDQDEYEVETLLDRMKCKDGTCAYLVKWADYPASHNSWEPTDCINNQQLLSLFNIETTKRVLFKQLEHNPHYIHYDEFLPLPPIKRRNVGRVLICGAADIPADHNEKGHEGILANNTFQSNVPVLGRDPVYIHYEGTSHIHDEWVSMENLLKLPKGEEKLKQYNAKCGRGEKLELPTNDNMCVDRVVTQTASVGQAQTSFVVKWKGLGYEHCSEEAREVLEDLVGFDVAFARFTRANTPHGSRKSRYGQCIDDHSLMFTSGKVRLKRQPLFLIDELPGYHFEGLNWMVEAWHMKHNFLYNDAMDLNRRMQMSVFLSVLAIYFNCAKPSLVICSWANVSRQVRMLQNLSPELNVIEYAGSPTCKRMIRQHEFSFFTESQKLDPALMKPKFDILVMDYQTFIEEKTSTMIYENCHWNVVVVEHESAQLQKKVDSVLNELAQSDIVAKLRVVLTQPLSAGQPLESTCASTSARCTSTELCPAMEFLRLPHTIGHATRHILTRNQHTKDIQPKRCVSSAPISETGDFPNDKPEFNKAPTIPTVLDSSGALDVNAIALLLDDGPHPYQMGLDVKKTPQQEASYTSYLGDRTDHRKLHNNQSDQDDDQNGDRDYDDNSPSLKKRPRLRGNFFQ